MCATSRTPRPRPRPRTCAILESLGVGKDTPQVEVWNKADRLAPEARAALAAQAARGEGVFLVSALTGEGLPALLADINARLSEPVSDEALRLDFGDGRRRAWLYEQGVVTGETPGEDGIRLNVRWTDRQRARYREL